MVEVSKSPINKPEVSLFMVDDNIEWFDISVHNTMHVTVVQSLKQSEEIKSDVKVTQLLEQDFAFNVWNELVYQTGSLRTRVSRDIIQLYNVWTSV